MAHRVTSFDDQAAEGAEAAAEATEAAPSIGEEPEARYMTADDLFAISDRRVESVTVPEWRGRDGRPLMFDLHSLDGAERDRYLNSIQYTDKRGRQRYDLQGSNARLIGMSAHDAGGNLLFKGQAKQEWLQQRNAGVLERIAKQVRRISGLDDLDEEDEKERREGLD